MKKLFLVAVVFTLSFNAFGNEKADTLTADFLETEYKESVNIDSHIDLTISYRFSIGEDLYQISCIGNGHPSVMHEVAECYKNGVPFACKNVETIDDDYSYKTYIVLYK